jgi:hypothetical protein
MNDTLLKAISERRLIELDYKGHHRMVAPHVYGIDSSGDEAVSVYQVWGGSQSGDAAGWKTFKVTDILDLKVTTRRFGVRPEYRHGDPAFKTIFRQV